MEVGAELHRVEMPPTTLARLIINLAGFPALRAIAALTFVNHPYVNAKCLNIKLNASNFPRRLQPKQ